MFNLIYFAYHFHVYLRIELSQLGVHITYLEPLVFNDPNKLPAKTTIKHQLGVLREIKETLKD